MKGKQSFTLENNIVLMLTHITARVNIHKHRFKYITLNKHGFEDNHEP